MNQTRSVNRRSPAVFSFVDSENLKCFQESREGDLEDCGIIRSFIIGLAASRGCISVACEERLLQESDA